VKTPNIAELRRLQHTFNVFKDERTMDDYATSAARASRSQFEDALVAAADFLLRATEERDALNAKLVELCGDFHENDADFIQWKMKRLGLWREAPKAGEGEQR